MNASDIASKAAELVGGDRAKQHGDKSDNFGRIAILWDAWLSVRSSADDRITAHDVGIMMALLKIARTQSGSHNMDDYVDSAGYIACAGEIAEMDEQIEKSVWDLMADWERKNGSSLAD
ncbi:MAG: DUF6378 domain-containing protein [Saprospiraceae bacterium]